MDKACSMIEDVRNVLEGNNHLEDRGIDGSILK
jgi:hypothetical protein